jgi:AcrR family transcriptional regulator
VSTRMSPTERRKAIIDATLAVMLRQGMAATTARDVAHEMGTSGGLIHHYFASMDDLHAAAFERAAAQGIEATQQALAGLPKADPVGRVQTFFATYVRAEQDWAFQLWLDAWSEASRRPVVREVSQRLNVAWQQLLAGEIREGVAAGSFRCADPDAAAWRILSLLDGLALQTVAHRLDLDREAVVAWSVAYAETELGLSAGVLTQGAGVLTQGAGVLTQGKYPSP